MLDLIIKGGTVVAPAGAGLMDVGIQGEQIAAVASPGALDDVGAGETIDATGMIVLPGGIEPHAHINVPVPDYWAGGDTGIYTQPPEAASRAAAFGGVTTYVDFAGALPLTPGRGAALRPHNGPDRGAPRHFPGPLVYRLYVPLHPGWRHSSCDAGRDR